MNVHDMALQFSLQAKALAASLALIFVQAHVFYHGSFLAETLAARGALEGKFRFLFVDFVLIDFALLSHIFFHFSFSPSDISFDFIW